MRFVLSTRSKSLDRGRGTCLSHHEPQARLSKHRKDHWTKCNSALETLLEAVLPQISMQLHKIFRSSHMMELQLSSILLNWLKNLLGHKIIKQLNCSQFPSSMINSVFCKLRVYTTIRKNAIYYTFVSAALNTGKLLTWWASRSIIVALDTPCTLSNKNWIYKQRKRWEKVMRLGDRLNWRLEACAVYYCSDSNVMCVYSFHSPNKRLNASNRFNYKSSSYLT